VRILFVCFLLAGFLKPSWSQSVNYRDLFGDDWEKARTYEKENRKWMKPVFAENRIPYPLAIAIIYPELVRYSALRDKMEITLLKALYVNLGEEYANFSIGVFQMKPSFAELLCDQGPAVLGKRSGIKLSSRSAFDDIKDFRKSILKDLEDPESQVNYLIAFIRICEKNFKTDKMSDLSRIKFLATAYNCGFNKTAEEIEKMSDKKFFSISLYKGENYSYADVSLFWYKQYMAEN
jgi:hypothetical protein